MRNHDAGDDDDEDDDDDDDAGFISRETRGNAVPIVKVFQNAKTALVCRILHIQSENFFGSYTRASAGARGA